MIIDFLIGLIICYVIMEIAESFNITINPAIFMTGWAIGMLF